MKIAKFLRNLDEYDPLRGFVVFVELGKIVSTNSLGKIKVWDKSTGLRQRVFKKRKNRGPVHHIMKLSQNRFVCSREVGGIECFMFDESKNMFCRRHKDGFYPSIISDKNHVRMMKIDEDRFLAINLSMEIIIYSFSKSFPPIPLKVEDQTFYRHNRFSEESRLVKSTQYPNSFYVNTISLKYPHEVLMKSLKGNRIRRINLENGRVEQLFSLEEEPNENKVMNMISFTNSRKNGKEENLVVNIVSPNPTYLKHIIIINTTTGIRQAITCNHDGFSIRSLYFSEGNLLIGGSRHHPNPDKYRRTCNSIDIFRVEDCCEIERGCFNRQEKMRETVNINQERNNVHDIQDLMSYHEMILPDSGEISIGDMTIFNGISSSSDVPMKCLAVSTSKVDIYQIERYINASKHVIQDKNERRDLLTTTLGSSCGTTTTTTTKMKSRRDFKFLLKVGTRFLFIFKSFFL